MKWEHHVDMSRLVSDKGQIVSEVHKLTDGTWSLSYNCARYVSREAAQAAAHRIHGTTEEVAPTDGA